MKGNVLVDTGIFVKQNDYVNVEGSYFVTIIGGKLFCRLCEEFNANKIILNGDIEIYLDSNEQIIGFAGWGFRVGWLFASRPLTFTNFVPLKFAGRTKISFSNHQILRQIVHFSG